MFSGIVEEAAIIENIEHAPELSRLFVKSSLDHSQTKIGDSIAVEGVCLTVVSIKDGGLLEFEAVPETLRCTTLGELILGDKVNLERSMKLGDRVHGHLVSGHVDETVKLISRSTDGESHKFIWEITDRLKGFIVPKGSITLSGISLTVGEVGDKEFSVYIIPHTLAVTTISKFKAGMRINLEIDMLARYVKSALDQRFEKA